jgi:hypothetical protein
MADFEYLGAEGAAYDGAFATHSLGHAVALHGGDHREGVAGVAARRFHYGVAG